MSSEPREDEREESAEGRNRESIPAPDRVRRGSHERDRHEPHEDEPADQPEFRSDLKEIIVRVLVDRGWKRIQQFR